MDMLTFQVHLYCSCKFKMCAKKKKKNHNTNDIYDWKDQWALAQFSPSHTNEMEGEFLVVGSRPTEYVCNVSIKKNMTTQKQIFHSINYLVIN